MSVLLTCPLCGTPVDSMDKMFDHLESDHTGASAADLWTWLYGFADQLGRSHARGPA